MAAAFTLALIVSPANAETCGAAPIAARGELSRLEWSARTKARANWRHKVRSQAALGTRYSNWSAARDTEERCIRSEGRIYCIFTGIPCAP